MLIGDLDLALYDGELDWSNFRQLYYTEIDALWSANFNKEDIANKSDKQFDIMLYQSAFYLAYLIKRDYIKGSVQEPN